MAAVNPVGFPIGIEDLDPDFPEQLNSTFQSIELRVDEVTKAFNLCVICDGTINDRGGYRSDADENEHGRFHAAEICSMQIKHEYQCGACHKPVSFTDSQTHTQLGTIHKDCETLANKVSRLLAPDNDEQVHEVFRAAFQINLGNGYDYALRLPVFEHNNGSGSGHIKPGIKIENHQKKHAEKWIGSPCARTSRTTLFPTNWDKNQYVYFFNQIINSQPISAVVSQVPYSQQDGDAIQAKPQPNVVVNLTAHNISDFMAQQVKPTDTFKCTKVVVQLAYGGNNPDGQFFWNIHMYPDRA